MEYVLIKNQRAPFINLFAAFIFDITFLHFLVLIVSIFIPDFYVGYLNSTSFTLYFFTVIGLYIIYLVTSILLKNQTIGMYLYNLILNRDDFSIINSSNIINIKNEVYNYSFGRGLISFLIDIPIIIFLFFLSAMYSQIGDLTNSTPSGGFLINNDLIVGFFYAFSGPFIYYVLSISLFKCTIGMALLKIKFSLMRKSSYILRVVLLPIFVLILIFLINY